MLTTKAQYRLGDAKEYFAEHLSVGDYYTEGQQVLGQWYGEGAEKLGLTGVTRQDDFVRLCENLHPKTREKLTMRQNTMRSDIGPDGQPRQNTNRRVFYDFTFSPAKSVSIAALVGHDPRIVEAHEQAVTTALGQLQAFASTRVRKNGQCTDRTTGNIVAAVFRHDTSRALDPQLHTHCIIFNATFDSVEARWKALQNHDMLSAQKFVENVYYHELSRRLRQFGYGIENQRRGDFEIKGVSPALVEKFSKRHQEIDQKTRELLEREPEKADWQHRRHPRPHRPQGSASQDQGHHPCRNYDQLGPTIDCRRKNVAWPTGYRATGNCRHPARHWRNRLSRGLRNICLNGDRWCLEHELWRHALEHVRGQNVDLADIQAATGRRGYLRYKEHPGRITTREVLHREWEIVCMARDGIRRVRPALLRPFDPQCQPGCRATPSRRANPAVAATLSPCFAVGPAPARVTRCGKCTALCNRPGARSPSSLRSGNRSWTWKRDGFQGAQTVSALLARGSSARGGVLLVDEAGQIGGQQMHQLLSLAQANEGRVILSGDTRQHGAVEASDALRAIEKYSTLQAIELTEIRRQDPARGKTRAEREQIAQYKQAVQEASEGNLDASFRRLDRQGAVVVCSATGTSRASCPALPGFGRQQQSVVVVSQTWSEIHRVNEQVRAALKSRGLLGAEDRTVTALETVDLTEAQKRDRRFYKEDTVIGVEPQCARIPEGADLSARGHHRQRLGSEECGQDSHRPVPVCGSAHRMPAQGTRVGGRRPSATEGQREHTSRPASCQWRTGHGEESRR